MTTETIQGKRLVLTIPEFAELAGLSRCGAYELARRGELPVPVIKLGRKLAVSRKAVERLFQGDASEAAR